MTRPAIKKTNNTLDQTAGLLSELSADLRHLSDILCLWIINTAEIDWKICLGEQVHHLHAVRSQLDKRLNEMQVRPTQNTRDNTSMQALLATAARCARSNEKGSLLLTGIYPLLMKQIKGQVRRTDVVMDNPSYRVLMNAFDEIQKMKNDTGIWFKRIHGKKIINAPGRNKLNSPLDYPYPLPIPAKPAREKPLLAKRKDNPDSTQNDFTKRLLHTNLVNLEIATMECCAAMLLEFRNIPAELYADMARQIWDEARHAEGCYRRMLELGGKLGDYPTDTLLWEMQKDRSLELRFAIHQRIGEWIGVDGAIWHAKKLNQTGDHITARIFEFIVADEITHVQFGNKWLAHLLKTEKEVQKIHKKALAVRKAFGKTTDSFTFPFNEWVCQATGFSERDVRKMDAAFKKKGSMFPALPADQ